MTLPRLLLVAALGGFALPAIAQEQIVDVPDCTAMCHLWRNLSGRVQVPVDAGLDPRQVQAEESTPGITDGAAVPRPERVVKQRGVVAVETPAERRERLRQRAALEKKLMATDVAATRGKPAAPPPR